MYAAVAYMARSLGSYGSMSALAILVAVGVLVYGTATLLLWSAAGRPYSAEYRLAPALTRKARSWRFREPKISG
jgi:hypothetical protein